MNLPAKYRSGFSYEPSRTDVTRILQQENKQKQHNDAPYHNSKAKKKSVKFDDAPKAASNTRPGANSTSMDNPIPSAPPAPTNAVNNSADNRPSTAGNRKNGKKTGKVSPENMGKNKKKKQNNPNNVRKKKNFLYYIGSCLGLTGAVKLHSKYAADAAALLDLNQSHLRHLRSKFDTIDVDGSGNIDAEEFLEAMGERRSPFTDRLFGLLDLDGSGTIEFDEYIRVLSTYCMFSKDDILRFCFECFDVDKSGSIDEREFVELCKTVNNAAPSFPANFKRALEDFDVNEDGLIDYDEFILIERRYPMILFPAFKLQDTMQRYSLGASTWIKVLEKYNKKKQVEEYKLLHGGKLPPRSIVKDVLKFIFPGLFPKKTIDTVKKTGHEKKDKS